MQERKAKKKLIYVMGCGRSGTTILGVALGKGNKCLDLGEVVNFLKRIDVRLTIMGRKQRPGNFGGGY